MQTGEQVETARDTNYMKIWWNLRALKVLWACISASFAAFVIVFSFFLLYLFRGAHWEQALFFKYALITTHNIKHTVQAFKTQQWAIKSKYNIKNAKHRYKGETYLCYTKQVQTLCGSMSSRRALNVSSETRLTSFRESWSLSHLSGA